MALSLPAATKLLGGTPGLLIFDFSWPCGMRIVVYDQERWVRFLTRQQQTKNSTDTAGLPSAPPLLLRTS